VSGIGIKPFVAKIGGGTTSARAVTTTAERNPLLTTLGLCIGSVAVLTPSTSSIVFIEFGDVTVTATANAGTDAATSSQPVPPGVLVVLGLPPQGATHYSAICASGGAATVYVTVGDGV
jgi:hypothetical protein